MEASLLMNDLFHTGEVSTQGIVQVSTKNKRKGELRTQTNEKKKSSKKKNEKGDVLDKLDISSKKNEKGDVLDKLDISTKKKRTKRSPIQEETSIGCQSTLSSTPPKSSILTTSSLLSVRSITTQKSKEETFLHRWMEEIQLVHIELREHYEGYRVSDGEILEIQDLLLSKKYKISPMRLVSRSLKEEDDFCELEGEPYRFPHDVNTYPKIHRRFPVDFLIQSLPSLSYSSPLLVSSDCRYSDNGEYYITSSTSDIVVILAFIIALIKSLMDEPSFFRKSCYNNYQTDDGYENFINAIVQWEDVVNVLYIECHNSKFQFSKSKLIERFAPLVNSDQYLMNLISYLINLPILDEAGKDYSSKTGAPMIPILDDILYNIYLDEIDQKMEDELSLLQYIRYQHYMLIPITPQFKGYELPIMNTLQKIFLECNLPKSHDRLYNTGSQLYVYRNSFVIKGGKCVNKGNIF